MIDLPAMGNVRAKILLTDDVAALVRSLHPHLKKKVRSAFQILTEDPVAGKPLKDELTGLRSFRVARYRIVYRLQQDGQIEIVTIGSRESIYEETYRLLKKQDR